MRVTLQSLSYGAALVAAIAGIVTLYQFNQNLAFEKDKLAIEMYRDFWQQRREFLKQQSPGEADAKAFAAAAQLAAETIYRFKEGDPGWRHTVRGMIVESTPQLLAVSRWNCRGMHLGYYCFMQETLDGKLSCDSAPQCPK